MYVADANKIALIESIASVFEAGQYKYFTSRVPGTVYPDLIRGTRCDERPDMTCFGTRRVIVDTITSEDLKQKEALLDRLFLFYSKAQSANWDFHIITFNALVPYVKSFCENHFIRYSKLWDI